MKSEYGISLLFFNFISHYCEMKINSRREIPYLLSPVQYLLCIAHFARFSKLIKKGFRKVLQVRCLAFHGNSKIVFTAHSFAKVKVLKKMSYTVGSGHPKTQTMQTANCRLQTADCRPCRLSAIFLTLDSLFRF